MTFGLNGEEMSLEEIASHFDITRERVRQLKEKALRDLRKSGALEQFRGYL